MPGTRPCSGWHHYHPDFKIYPPSRHCSIAHEGNGFQSRHSSNHYRDSPGKLMDLVYPPVLYPCREHVQAEPDRCLMNTKGTMRPVFQMQAGHSVASTAPAVGKCQGATWLVGETGEWKKRRSPCMCKVPECPGLSLQQGLAYMAVKLVKVGNGMERYFDFRTKRELKVSKQAVDHKHGFRLSDSPHAAVSLLSGGQFQSQNVVVLRGIASGMGCQIGEVTYAPSFRPVCAMDYIVTKF